MSTKTKKVTVTTAYMTGVSINGVVPSVDVVVTLNAPGGTSVQAEVSVPITALPERAFEVLRELNGLVVDMFQPAHGSYVDAEAGPDEVVRQIGKPLGDGGDGGDPNGIVHVRTIF